ncbi:hypothetical protein BDN71DRAFT_1512010 [Pleurotus eryngii]|uniref:Uncharacterized protein n=1 Tax=Pleurotus eryngii TaxID=5323 RepID=A0A9P5ZMW9_PLEER|nr:hypothetical protein BDN71DRAFT_1512010 [Pleurotus eryngii]
MGFFSSRKDDLTTSPEDKSKVVQVIRSRFYGKSKAKGREEPDAFFSTAPSPAQALSPLTRRPTTVKHANRPATTFENTASTSTARPATVYQIDITSQSPRAPLAPATLRTPKIIPTESPHKTDAVTVTLAQRLDELAKANSDGLLNDEEYRLLRQDLFQRFASGSTVPTEAAIVPTSRRRAGTGTTSRSSITTPSRPTSQFHVDTTRSPSTRSKGSVSSGMGSFFSRITDSRPRSDSKDHSDVSSVYSAQSNISNTFHRLLTRKTSQSSVGTDTGDAVSITSRRTDRSLIDKMGVSRSTTSVRRMAAPPSAFSLRIGQTEAPPPPVVGVGLTNIFDEANLTTSQDIRKEILAVESEKRRLMDSFNSLELRVLTQNQRRGTSHALGAPTRDIFGETGTSSPSLRTVDHGESLRRRVLDTDAVSIRSGLSTSPSLARSAASWRTRSTTRTGTGPSSISESSIRHKNSRRVLEEIPPLPPLPGKLPVSGYLGVPSSGSNSSHSPTSLTADNSSFLTLDTLPEDDVPSVTDEMDEIKLRREEVAARYEARLEYLQAKLKGAQLHEKLLRK